MKVYVKPNTLARQLGFPPDGKRFSKALIEVGIKLNGRTFSPECLKKGIARRHSSGTWTLDAEAVECRIMGGYLSPGDAKEAEAIAAELVAVDREFTESCSSKELVALGDRWAAAVARIRPVHHNRINGILMRDGCDFCVDREAGDVLPIGHESEEDVA